MSLAILTARFIVALSCMRLGVSLFAVEIAHLPDEFDAYPGYSVGLNNTGVAGAKSISAIRLNPALLPLEKHYRVAADYHWPRSGRDFYQASVVDSQTAKFSAGLIYTGFLQKTEELRGAEQRFDTPVKTRINLGLAKSFGRASLGVLGHYIEGYSASDGQWKLVKAATFGFGLATQLTANIRLGVSAENLGNDEVKEFAPYIVRAGVSANFFGGLFQIDSDYMERERVSRFESCEPLFVPGQGFVECEVQGLSSAELSEAYRSANFAATGLVWGVVRPLLGYGVSVNSNQRSFSAGVAYEHQGISLAYQMRQPDHRQKTMHRVISFGMNVRI